MKVIVDADACPVKETIIKVAKEYELEVVMVIDTNHVLEDGYSKVIMVGQGKDAVDIALINQVKGKDIVVTQDYGVATMALGKGAYAINQNGFIFSQENIDKLLFERFLSQKVRRSGGRLAGPRRRKKEDDEHFERSFRQLCADAVKAGD